MFGSDRTVLLICYYLRPRGVGTPFKFLSPCCGCFPCFIFLAIPLISTTPRQPSLPSITLYHDNLPDMTESDVEVDEYLRLPEGYESRRKLFI